MRVENLIDRVLSGEDPRKVVREIKDTTRRVISGGRAIAPPSSELRKPMADILRFARKKHGNKTWNKTMIGIGKKRYEEP